jgi:hypothetical protein
MLKKILCLLAAVAFIGCGTNGETDLGPEPSYVTSITVVTIPYGQEVAVEGTVLRMNFGDVLEDSRCAVDVVCVWEGNGKVEVGIRAGMGPTSMLQLNTSLEPRDAEWNDVLVTLVELTPAPTSGDPISLGDYSVTLRLEPLG